jgi:hypothetical protein
MNYTLVMFATLAMSPTNTVFSLATVQRDLTGDGKAEVLRLVARGQTLDSLAVTFIIESSGRLLFQTDLVPLTRTSFDPGRRRLPRAEHRAKLTEFPKWFFDERKFTRPAEFLEQLQGVARGHIALIPEVIAHDRRRQLLLDSLLHTGLSRAEAERRARSFRRSVSVDDSLNASAIWQEIQRTGVTIFEFSPGGDAVYPIAWSARDQRFYRLVECC